MTNINNIKLMLKCFDIIDEETSINVMDKNGKYNDLEYITHQLSKIWHMLDIEPKRKIALAFTDAFMDYTYNKVKYDKICKRVEKAPLSKFIKFTAAIRRDHIVYDYLNERFQLYETIDKSNANNLWHFEPAYLNMDDSSVLEFLNSITIKHFDDPEKFIKQQIEYTGLDIEISSIS